MGWGRAQGVVVSDLPVQRYSCEDSWQAEKLAWSLAEERARELELDLVQVELVDQSLNNCGLRFANYLFCLKGKGSSRCEFRQRIEFVDESPLHIRFPRDCYCDRAISSLDELAPALLSLRYGEEYGRPLLVGGQCERPELSYTDELLFVDSITGHFVLLRHWEVRQPCFNVPVYLAEQRIFGLLSLSEGGEVYLDFSETDSAFLSDKHLSRSFLEAYPNPAQNYLKIVFSVVQTGEVLLEVRNIEGQVYAKKSYWAYAGEENSWLIPARHLPSGTYWIRLLSGDEILQTSFVKLR